MNWSESQALSGCVPSYKELVPENDFPGAWGQGDGEAFQTAKHKGKAKSPVTRMSQIDCNILKMVMSAKNP
jgi:hypothetical protein